MKFGLKLLKYLEKNNIKYSHFAREIGISSTGVNKYLHHNGAPSYIVAQKICYVTNGYFTMDEMGFPANQ